MPASTPIPNSSETPPPRPRWPEVVLGLFAVAVVVSVILLSVASGGNAGWSDGLLLIVGCAAAVAALSRQLPAPNVLLAGGVAALMGGLAHAVNSVVGWPFGRFELNASFGPRWLGVLPLAMVGVWAAVALTARGLARLLLHHARHHPRHGFRILGLAAVLTMLFSLGFELFAVTVKGWWTANPTPSLNVASWGALGLLIQIAITPLLIDKFPGPRPPNSWPLLVWIGFNTTFVLGLAVKQCWGQATIVGAGLVIVCGLAAFRKC